MEPPEPIPLEMLKKMYLVVLFELKEPGGKYASDPTMGHGWQSVAEYMPRCFGFNRRLTQQERNTIRRAVFLLERDEYLQQDPGQGESFKILTDRGRKYALRLRDNLDSRLPSINLVTLLTRPDLLENVRASYDTADYDTAIFKAFKLLEKTVRSKHSGLKDRYGKALMDGAFKKGTGILKQPLAQDEGDEEYFHHLMRGSLWFRNPATHDTVSDDPESTAHILAFANLLMDLVDECEKR